MINTRIELVYKWQMTDTHCIEILDGSSSVHYSDKASARRTK